MTQRVVEWALNAKNDHTWAERYLLLVLACDADEYGLVVDVDVPRMAKRIQTKEREIRKHLAALMTSGILKMDTPARYGLPGRFQLAVPPPPPVTPDSVDLALSLVDDAIMGRVRKTLGKKPRKKPDEGEIGADGKRRTRIAPAWGADEAGKKFAADRGVNHEIEEERFLSFHLGKGTLMFNWAAAWRTWVMNAASRLPAGARRAPDLPLLNGFVNGGDEWGIQSWVARLPELQQDTIDGRPVMTLGGYDVAATAADVCRAANLPPAWRGSLDQIAVWLRDGFSPEQIEGAIRGARRQPDIPGAWRYYDKIVRDTGRSA